jgi:hypothetical protein
MEVQPLTAEATMPQIDPQAPYCYAAYRLDRTPPEMIAWAAWSQPPGPFTEPYHAATYEVSRIRVAEQYYGPMRVQVWNHREDESYSKPPPEDAYCLYVGDPNPTMRAEMAVLRDRAVPLGDLWDTARRGTGDGRPVDGPGCTPHTFPALSEDDLLTALRGKVADDDPPPGVYCACSDPNCPTPDGQYTHGTP